MATEYKLSYTAAQINSKLGEIENLAKKSDIPTKISSLVNDAGYLTEHQSLDGLASENYVDEKVGTITAESIGALPNTTEIPVVPTDISAFNNDIGYLTEHQSLDGLATEDYVAEQIAAIQMPDANVTAESIENALGFTPADAEVVGDSVSKQQIAINNICDNRYVIDFGLPVKINTNDFDLYDRTLVSGTGTYGTVTVDDGGKSFVYTPTTILSGIDTVELIFSDETTTTVQIIPATTMHYDDSFLTFEDAKMLTTDANGKTVVATDENGNTIYYTGDIGTWFDDGVKLEGLMQSTDRVGMSDHPYGYDIVYKNSIGFSNGSSKKATVNADAGKQVNCPNAKFTFTGTGFDVHSTSSNKTGVIVAFIYDDTGATIANAVSITYSNLVYDEATGTFVTNNDYNIDNTYYQTSVISKHGLPYGTYTVELMCAYMPAYDLAKAGSYTIWIDSICVYDTMLDNSDALNAYKLDEEDLFAYVNTNALQKTSFSDTSGTKVSILTFKQSDDGYIRVTSNADSIAGNVFGPSHVYAFQLNVIGNNPRVQVSISNYAMNSGTDSHISFVDSFDHSNNTVHYSDVKIISTQSDMYYEVPIVKYKDKYYVIAKHTGDSNFVDVPMAKLANCEIITQPNQEAVDEFISDIVFIANKTVPVQAVQADWNKTDETASDFIKNKPFDKEEEILQWDGNLTNNNVI